MSQINGYYFPLSGGSSGGSGGTETDPTVPSHVKSITQEDIDKWNSGGTETPKILEGTSTDPIILYDLDDGFYCIKGHFKLNSKTSTVLQTSSHQYQSYVGVFLGKDTTIGRQTVTILGYYKYPYVYPDPSRIVCYNVINNHNSFSAPHCSYNLQDLASKTYVDEAVANAGSGSSGGITELVGTTENPIVIKDLEIGVYKVSGYIMFREQNMLLANTPEFILFIDAKDTETEENPKTYYHACGVHIDTGTFQYEDLAISAGGVSSDWMSSWKINIYNDTISLRQAAGYDESKKQVLKQVNGVFIWEDEV